MRPDELHGADAEFLFIGGLALGVAIAWLVVHFLQRFTVFNEKVLGAVVCIVAGGTVTAFLGASGKLYSWSGYCIGLCFGVVMFGHRQLHVVPQSESKKEPTRDSRLEMLDELHSRSKSGVISQWDFEQARSKILSDISDNPHRGSATQ